MVDKLERLYYCPLLTDLLFLELPGQVAGVRDYNSVTAPMLKEIKARTFFFDYCLSKVLDLFQLKINDPKFNHNIYNQTLEFSSNFSGYKGVEVKLDFKSFKLSFMRDVFRSNIFHKLEGGEEITYSAPTELFISLLSKRSGLTYRGFLDIISKKQSDVSNRLLNPQRLSRVFMRVHLQNDELFIELPNGCLMSSWLLFRVSCHLLGKKGDKKIPMWYLDHYPLALKNTNYYICYILKSQRLINIAQSVSKKNGGSIYKHTFRAKDLAYIFFNELNMRRNKKVAEKIYRLGRIMREQESLFQEHCGMRLFLKR